MTRRLTLDQSSLSLPDGWAVSSLMIHLEDTEAVVGEPPFAANIVIAPRLDIEPGDNLDEVLAHDRESLASLQGFELIGQERMRFGDDAGRAIEYEFIDRGRRLRQRIILRTVGEHAYSVCGTHVAGDAFESIRPQIDEVARSLLPSR